LTKIAEGVQVDLRKGTSLVVTDIGGKTAVAEYWNYADKTQVMSLVEGDKNKGKIINLWTRVPVIGVGQNGKLEAKRKWTSQDKGTSLALQIDGDGLTPVGEQVLQKQSILYPGLPAYERKIRVE
jgi:hypothetical protein